MFKRSRLNQTGIIHLIPLFILLLGIFAGVYLVQNQQIFKPKAAAESFQILDGPCVRVKDGEKVLICDRFQFRLTSPLDSQSSSDVGPNMSFVKTVYAQEFVEGGTCGTRDRSSIIIPGSQRRPLCPSGTRCEVVERDGKRGAECAPISAGGAGDSAGNIVAHCGLPGVVYYDNAPFWQFWQEKEVCVLSGKVCQEFTNSNGDRDAGCFAAGEQAQPAPAPAPTPTCTNDISCSDGNSCTEDKCVDGQCVYNNKEVGTACLYDRDTYAPIKYCAEGGKCELNEPAPKTCTNDIGCTDGNACTEDKCEDGKCVNANKPAGTACANDPNTFQPVKFCSQDGQCEVEKKAAPAAPPSVKEPAAPAVGAPAPPVEREAEEGAVLVSCQDNPPGERPQGYRWDADCQSYCTDTKNHTDCPQSDDPFVNRETSNWCYGFAEGNKCLMLKREVAEAITPSPTPTPPPPGVGTTAPVEPTVSPSPSPAAISTKYYRYAEDPTSLGEWLPYTAGGVIVSHKLTNTTLEPKFIYAEFTDIDKINIIRAKPYPFVIKLVDYATIGASPSPAGAVIPAGSECSAYETTSVCGGGLKTYDKCTDDKGQTGNKLCSGQATKFYCEGSTNSNCTSRYNDSQKKVLEGTFQYSCSACPNLSSR